MFVLTTGGVHEDLGLGTAARSAILKVMRAVPEPFRPAAAATSQRILVDPAGWMHGGDPVGQLGVLQAAVFTDLAEQAADVVALYSNMRYSNMRLGMG